MLWVSDNITLVIFYSKCELAGKGVGQISRNRGGALTENLILAPLTLEPLQYTITGYSLAVPDEDPPALFHCRSRP